MIFDLYSTPTTRAFTIEDLDALRDRMAAARPPKRRDTVIVPGLGRATLLDPDGVG